MCPEKFARLQKELFQLFEKGKLEGVFSQQALLPEAVTFIFKPLKKS